MSVVLGLGVGLSASLALAEILSIAPGGYIVPGYLALSLNQPGRVLATVGVALATFLVMRLVARFVIVRVLHGVWPNTRTRRSRPSASWSPA